MKLELKNSENVGELPELGWVNVDLIKVDRAYQREESEKHVNDILKNFNWRNFQPVTLALRSDDTFNVVDGQHRVAAAKLHPQITEVPALVFKSHDEVKGEAKTFVEINSKRKGISAVEKHIAAIAAEDPESLALNIALEEVNCIVARYTGDKGLNVVVAVTACKKSIKQHGVKNFKAAVRTLRQAWPTDIDVLRAVLITSLSHIYKYNPEMDEFHMAAELKKHGMAELFNLARALIKMRGGGTALSLKQVIVDLYNKTMPRDGQINKP
ncbi:MAG: ParB N-terminal domain-containing protein [Rhizobiales bacterium]|nr:ParB N-terminal domain-containing protein [Hyphomicrobiales bacterium]